LITLIGTGHVFNLSEPIQNILDEKKPDLICVELDQQRYETLLLKEYKPEEYKKTMKNTPFIYQNLARFQENIAKQYGVIAGSEMLSAIKYAQTHQIPLELIDMNAQIIFTRMWKTMRFTEKLGLIIAGFTGLFISKKIVEKEIDDIQQNFEVYITEIEKKFPSIKRVLIDERDAYMADKLYELQKKYNLIVACVGDGHIKGLTRLLQEKNIKVDAIRLNQLRTITRKTDDASSASFSVNYKPP
jgi:pheromone shutdown-related protein TraB